MRCGRLRRCGTTAATRCWAAARRSARASWRASSRRRSPTRSGAPPPRLPGCAMHLRPAAAAAMRQTRAMDWWRASLQPAGCRGGGPLAGMLFGAQGDDTFRCCCHICTGAGVGCQWLQPPHTLGIAQRAARRSRQAATGGRADAERRAARRAYATLGHDPGAVMLDAAALQMTERIAHFRPQARSRPETDRLPWPAGWLLPPGRRAAEARHVAHQTYQTRSPQTAAPHTLAALHAQAGMFFSDLSCIWAPEEKVLQPPNSLCLMLSWQAL